MISVKMQRRAKKGAAQPFASVQEQVLLQLLQKQVWVQVQVQERVRAEALAVEPELAKR